MAVREVFLSHSSQDHAEARRLKEILTAHGIPVWFSPHKLVGAQLWHDEIGKALARCDWMMVLLTPAAVQSKWVKREVVYAAAEDRYDDHVIPLLFEPCKHRKLS